jgi:hypothetical protein
MGRPRKIVVPTINVSHIYEEELPNLVWKQVGPIMAEVIAKAIQLRAKTSGSSIDLGQNNYLELDNNGTVEAID